MKCPTCDHEIEPSELVYKGDPLSQEGPEVAGCKHCLDEGLVRKE